MKKNILIISASPRKGGNSDVLCDRFGEGAAAAGHAVEKIFLREKKVNYCVACDYCKSHNGECPQKDDMAEILAKLISADVIVLATPVYFYTMDAQLKTLIDRTVAQYTKISHKNFYFIATAADPNKAAMELTFNGLRGFLSCLPGAREMGALYGTGVWHKGEVQSTALLNEAYELGRRA